MMVMYMCTIYISVLKKKICALYLINDLENENKVQKPVSKSGTHANNKVRDFGRNATQRNASMHDVRMTVTCFAHLRARMHGNFGRLFSIGKSTNPSARWFRVVRQRAYS
jgi:hypothetical protein